MSIVTGSANILVLTELIRCYFVPVAQPSALLMIRMYVHMYIHCLCLTFNFPNQEVEVTVFNCVCWSTSLHTEEYAASWGSAASVAMLHSGLWQRWASQKTTLCTLQRRIRFARMYASMSHTSNNPTLGPHQWEKNDKWEFFSYWWGPRIGSKRLNQVTSTSSCELFG